MKKNYFIILVSFIFSFSLNAKKEDIKNKVKKESDSTEAKKLEEELKKLKFLTKEGAQQTNQKETKDTEYEDVENYEDYEDDENYSYAGNKTLGLSLRLGYSQSIYLGVGVRYHFSNNLYLKLTFDFSREEEDTLLYTSNNNAILETIEYYQDSLILMTQFSENLFIGGGLQILSLRGTLDIDGEEIDPIILKRAYGISGNIEWVFPMTRSLSFSIYGDLGYYFNAPEIGYANISVFDTNTNEPSQVTGHANILDTTHLNIGISALFMF